MSQRARRGLAAWMTSSPTPFFVLDHRRVLLVFNRGCEELTGWTASEVIGKTCDYVQSPIPEQVECLTSTLCPPQSTFDSRESSTQDVVIQTKTGEILKRTIQFHILTGDDSPDQKVRFLGVIAPTQTPPEAEVQISPNQQHVALTGLLADLYDRFDVDNIVAATPQTERLLAQIAIARDNQYPVHLIGPVGVGKEHLARSIHYGGRLKLSRFAPLRCKESSHFELKRALRQLVEEKKIEAEVYLDQVDHLARDLQELVLSAMQDRPQLRWMSSSNSGLNEDNDSEFSQELRCQLLTQTLHAPPLAERSDELLLLAQHLLEDCNRDQEKQVEGFSSEVTQNFQLYNWPGNVEELGRVVRESWQKSAGQMIEMSDLPVDFQIGFDAQLIGPIPAQTSLDERMHQYEWQEISKALDAAQGNKTIAAKALGIPRAKLYRRMESLGIEAIEEES